MQYAYIFMNLAIYRILINLAINASKQNTLVKCWLSVAGAGPAPGERFLLDQVVLLIEGRGP